MIYEEGILGLSDNRTKLIYLVSITSLSHEYAHIIHWLQYGYYDYSNSWMKEGVPLYCEYVFDYGRLESEQYTYENKDVSAASTYYERACIRYRETFGQNGFSPRNLNDCYAYEMLLEMGELDISNHWISVALIFYLIDNYGRKSFLYATHKVLFLPMAKHKKKSNRNMRTI